MIESIADIQINIERLKKDILELAEIGKDHTDHGIYRMAFTDADMEAKRWLEHKIKEAGLEFSTDGAANLFGRYHGKADDKPSVVVGSHIDTVPCAGALDGTLGVLIGLESLRRMKEEGVEVDHPIELVAFTDEEGRFGGMFGSQSFCGKITPETIESAKDLNGVYLKDIMGQQGYDPWAALDAKRLPDTLHAYLELHIEQGPVLDSKSVPVGIVEQITGLFKWNVTLKGAANHAGTTPMAMRNDAFLGLADFAHEIPRILDENGTEKSRATIGKVGLHPGSPNTVPGAVEFSLDVRDTSQDVLDELGLAIRKALSAIARRSKLMFDFEVLSEIKPVNSDVRILKTLEKNAKKLNYKYEKMPSGAAHDAQILATIVPTAMVFVPSKDGKSHSPYEWTDWRDIEAGANLMMHAIMDLANRDTLS